MLVWLASYPRSGNTLLRQVLKGCFDLDSCAGLEPSQAAGIVKPCGDLERIYGEYYFEGDPEEFYRRARSSPELVLVKSHQPPRDEEKAIYVVRDGRLALKSFAAYQDLSYPGTATADDLLIGDHAYGDWTSHYRAWTARAGQTLVVRFEELVDASPELLARLGSFLALSGTPRAWVNPQAVLRANEPTLFGPGHRVWAPDTFWPPARLRAFYTVHGPLLTELGYASAAEVEEGAHPPGSEHERYLRQTLTLAARVRALQQVCDERLVVIDQLKRVCDERLDALHALTREAETRGAMLHDAQNECARLRASRQSGALGRGIVS